MQLVSDLDLPLLPAETLEFSADPMRYMEEARKKHPWLAKSSIGGYIVHTYKACKDMCSNDVKTRPFYSNFGQYYGVEDSPWGHFISEMMNAAEGETHHRLRMSCFTAFTPKNVNRFRGVMRDVISDLLDKWVPKGKFDFAEFAEFFPITVFCSLLGVSTEVVPKINKALEGQTSSAELNKANLPKILAAFDVLWDFADNAVKEHEKRGGHDGGLIDTMIAARDAGKLSDTEMRQNLIMFAAAGYDTSKNMLGHIMYQMLQHTDQWARCADDFKYTKLVVEECLRHSSIPTIYRSVIEDYEYDGVFFPKGTMLILLLSMAGRDATVFENPLDFQPERANARDHVTFGRGEHYCIGMHLARAQLEEATHLISQRLLNPRVDGEVKWRPYMGVWGVKSLPIAFDPAPRREPAKHAAE
jgi:cytochrome P450